MSEGSPSTNHIRFVLIAVLVSRVEALCLKSLLEHRGIQVFMSANHHASVEINSLVLGGHRLEIIAEDYQLASKIIRNAGAHEDWEFSTGLQKAVLKVLGFWLGFNLLFLVPAIVMGSIPVGSLSLAALHPIVLNVNPQGRGDYFLADDKSL